MKGGCASNLVTGRSIPQGRCPILGSWDCPVVPTVSGGLGFSISLTLSPSKLRNDATSNPLHAFSGH